jgi:hypothetical protein
MSGICSKHQGHDPTCNLCMAVPLTKEEEAYYKGWDEHGEAQLNNCWTPVENCVLNTFTRLEDAARKIAASETHPDLEMVLSDIDKLRELKRGMWKRDLEQ